mmetsp:Transcript_42600/g.90162  ORF Transcript_42600/g.90162 Transcript_42600/m.90162 type:complete len:261 (+) Transcript_42600:687-1469(+)
MPHVGLDVARIELLLEVVQGCDYQPCAMVLELRQRWVVSPVFRKLKSQHVHCVLQGFDISSQQVLLAEISIIVSRLRRQGRLLKRRSCLVLRRIGLGLQQLKLLVRFADHLLVGLRSASKFILQLGVDLEISLHLHVGVQQLLIFCHQSLRLARLKMELGGHLFVLHYRPLRCRVQLVLRLASQRVACLSDLVLHILLQLVNVLCLASVDGADFVGLGLLEGCDVLPQLLHFRSCFTLLLPQILKLLQIALEGCVLGGQL